jgi:hypothetical protein
MGVQAMSEKQTPEFLAEFCENFSKHLEENVTIQPGPLPADFEVKSIAIRPCQIAHADPAALVRVRPCENNPENKTYLGFLLGEAPLQTYLVYEKPTKTLKVLHVRNPLIFIPELLRCVYGAGSFWGTIKDPEYIRDITDPEIGNLWYIKALKSATGKDSDIKGKMPENDQNGGAGNV